MNEQLAAGMRLAPLAQWLAARGLAGADLEAKGDMLIIHLPASAQVRFLRETDLREQAVSQGKALGFARVALDLPLQ